MSLHSYSRVWPHLVWATLERRPLISKAVAPKISKHLLEYAAEKGIYMKINYVNSDHVHTLVDLPTRLAIEQMMQLFKGESSHWINQNRLLPGRFHGAEVMECFRSVIQALAVARYIATQEEHHRKRTFTEELKILVERYGLKWYEEETVETVKEVSGVAPHPPKGGC